MRRNSGTSEKASRNSSGRLVHSREQSIGVNIHLWALTTRESARSIPSNAQRSSGQTMAEPAYAASTWSHAPAAAQRSPIAGSGSTDVVEVVPTVATTAATSSSSSASARIRNSSSEGTLRSSIPSIRAALSAAECACSEQTTTLRPVVCRAAIRAASVEVEAVSSMCPCQPGGSPISCATQSQTRSSSSVDAGAVRQRKPTELSVAASSSARIPGSAPVVAKYAKNRGMLPVRDAGEQDLVEVAQYRVEGLGLLGRRLRQPGADLARPHLREHGQLGHALEVVGRPVDRLVAVLPEGRPSLTSCS